MNAPSERSPAAPAAHSARRTAKLGHLARSAGDPRLSTHVRRTVTIALVVGTILFCINQLDDVLRGEADAVVWTKSAVTYIVPFCVSCARGAHRYPPSRCGARRADDAHRAGGAVWSDYAPVAREEIVLDVATTATSRVRELSHGGRRGNPPTGTARQVGVSLADLVEERLTNGPQTHGWRTPARFLATRLRSP